MVRTSTVRPILAVAAAILIPACGGSDPAPDRPAPAAAASPSPAAAPPDVIGPIRESADILARAPVAERTYVQHVLIAWDELARAYDDELSVRSRQRSAAEAEVLAAEILVRARAGDDFAALMKAYSEDAASATNGGGYTAAADAALVEPFKNLALRLQLEEVGAVLSEYGWHVIKRIPEPVIQDSHEILQRDPVTNSADVRHILIGWGELAAAYGGQLSDRAKERSPEDGEVVAAAAYERALAGEDFKALMKELSDDWGSANTGQSYTATADARLVEPFKNLALRLEVDEVGVVRSQYGWHIMQRIE